MKEGTFTKLVNSYLKSYGSDIWFYKASDRFTRGIPDFIGSYLGNFFAIELKASNKKPKLIQQYTLNKINNVNQSAICTDNMVDIIKLFKDLKNRSNNKTKTKHNKQ